MKASYIMQKARSRAAGFKKATDADDELSSARRGSNLLKIAISTNRDLKLKRLSFTMESAFCDALQDMCLAESLALNDFVANAVRAKVLADVRQQFLLSSYDIEHAFLEMDLIASNQPASEPPKYDLELLMKNGKARAPITLHVLVADDVRMSREITSSFLVSAGHTVTSVDGGQEAVAAVASNDFDVAMIDLRMPEVDGLEATRRIRSLRGKRGRTPIIALTSIAFLEQIEECFEAGMDAHLAKPFDPETLQAAVLRASVLRRPFGDPIHPDDCQTIASDLNAGISVPVINETQFEHTAAKLPTIATVGYLRTIFEQAGDLITELNEANALALRAAGLANSAHILAGNAGLFGLERLNMATCGFERAIETSAAHTPDLVDGLKTILRLTRAKIEDRIQILVEA